VGPLLAHGPGEFFQKERIAPCFGDDGLHQRRWEWCGLEHRLHHLQAILRQQPREGHLGGDRLRQPGWPIPWPVRHQ